MSKLHTECGEVELENLENVGLENFEGSDWYIKLDYKNKTEPTLIKCKNQNIAINSLIEISNNIEKP